MKSMNFAEYLSRPVPDHKRADFQQCFGSADTANSFLKSLDSIRKKHDISDWKREINKLVTKFEGDATVSKKDLRDITTKAMDFESLEAIFGNISGKYDDEVSVDPIGKSLSATKTGRITLDTIVDSVVSNTNRYSQSRNLQNSHSVSAPDLSSRTHFTATSANIVNIDKRAIQVALQQQRMEKIFRTPVLGKTLETMTKAAEYARRAANMHVVKRPQQLFTQAAALAQKLFAEIARNPESYVKLSQSETSALNSQKVATPSTRSADPKAELRLMAIKAMNNAYSPNFTTQASISSLQAAIKKVDDQRKKHLHVAHPAADNSLDGHLKKLGYKEEERARLVPILSKNSALADYLESGTISTSKDLDNVLSSLGVSAKAKQLA